MSCQVRFVINRVVNELAAIGRVGARFLTNVGKWAEDALSTDLNQLRGSSQGKWQTASSRQIQTIASRGEYVRSHGGQKGPPIFAEVRFVWDVRAVLDKRSRIVPGVFDVAGRASIVVSLFA